MVQRLGYGPWDAVSAGQPVNVWELLPHPLCSLLLGTVQEVEVLAGLVPSLRKEIDQCLGITMDLDFFPGCLFLSPLKRSN